MCEDSGVGDSIHRRRHVLLSKRHSCIYQTGWHHLSLSRHFDAPLRDWENAKTWLQPRLRCPITVAVVRMFRCYHLETCIPQWPRCFVFLLTSLSAPARAVMLEPWRHLLVFPQPRCWRGGQDVVDGALVFVISPT